jgi:hypothetical protein
MAAATGELIFLSIFALIISYYSFSQEEYSDINKIN